MLLGIEAISIVAIFFGAIWLAVGLYTYSPVYRTAFLRLIGRATGPRVYGKGSDVDDSDLPTIDVLLPAYDERETIAHSIRALREADYPDDRLAINVLLEPSDVATRQELWRLRDHFDFRELVIPASYPGPPNKPRALNYGYERTDGDIVGVIDAEDVVAPDLFKQVVRALVDGGHDYVQGRLDMQNEDDGLLNTLFRGEYGFWYGTVIPSYFRVGYPVPLGGTTNFVTRSVLTDVAADRVERFGSPWTRREREAIADGGCTGRTPWDPRNVTEDFELGLLLWETGRSMAMVTAVTREESPVGFNAWIRQRTRWQKGKLYTLVQRLRSPPTGVRPKLHVYAQSAMPHLGPINLLGVLIIAIYATLVGFMAAPIVAVVLVGGLALAIQQMAIQAAGYWTVTDARGARRARRTVANFLAVPLYWGLQWGADVRAFVQLAFGHRGWEKTAHKGRHIETTVSPGPASTKGGLRMAVVQAGDSWLWTVGRDGVELARASRRFASTAEAAHDAEQFGGVLAVARGIGPVFRVDRRNEGWGWTLNRDSKPFAAGSTVSPDASESLDAVERTRRAAGVADAGSERNRKPERTPPAAGPAEIAD